MIKIGNNCELNLERLIATRMLINANSGGGKSFCIRRLLEQSFGKIQHIVIDLEGEFSTLREQFGYLLVGKDGEIPTNIRTAELLAKKLLQLNVSTIIDLSELKHPERITFVKRFLDSLINSPKELWHPLLVVIDEAHIFCLDEDTEILTENGWKKYNEINVGDIAFSYNKETNEIEKKPIKRKIIRESNEEKMIHLYNEDSIDSLVTKDHRVICSTRTIDSNRKGIFSKNKFIFAKDLPTGIKIPLVGEYKSISSLNIDKQMLRILGWIITDGHLHKFKNSNPSYEISQSESKGIILENMKKIILERFPKCKIHDREGRIFSKYNDKKEKVCSNHKSSRAFNFYLGTEYSHEIKKWLGNSTHRIPRIILNHANKEQLQELFLGLIEGDGSVSKSKNGYIQRRLYCGNNEGLADDFQELCILLGLSSSKILDNNTKQWRVLISEKRKYASVRRTKEVIYTGKTWDITIDNGAFIVRRNGKPFITGNCPEGAKSESASAVIDLATRGRKRGFTAVLATQRISKLSKDAAAELNNVMTGRTGLDIDQKRAGDILGFTNKEDIRALRDLKAGEFHCFGPAFNHNGVQKFLVGEVKTTHPDRTKGIDIIKPIETPENIKKLLKDVVDLPKEAEEEIRTLNEYKNKVKELKTRLTLAEKQKVNPIIKTDEKSLEKAREQGFKEAERQTRLKIKEIEKNIENNEKQYKTIIRTYERKINEIGKILGQEIPKVEINVIKYDTHTDRDTGSNPVGTKVLSSSGQAHGLRESSSSNLLKTAGDDSPYKLKSGAIRMLKAIAMFDSLKREKAKTLAGISNPTTFSTYIQDLKRAGCITESDRILKITQEGLNFVGDVPEIPTDTASLVNMWSKFIKAGAIRMLNICVEKYPDLISRTELKDSAGIENPTTFSTYLQDLKRNGLIEINGADIKASEELFE